MKEKSSLTFRNGFYSTMAIILLFLSLSFSSCTNKTVFKKDFNKINTRTWIGEDFWAVPLEDWQVNKERIEATGSRENMRVNILSVDAQKEGSFQLAVHMGVISSGLKTGSGGIRIAISDDTDTDYRSLCYFGKGINIGINSRNEFFIDDSGKSLPADFDLSSFVLQIDGKSTPSEKYLTAAITDRIGRNISVSINEFENLSGMISLVNNFPGEGNFPEGSGLWFDNITLSGTIFEHHPERKFGPVFWTMYTIHENTLKMSAQLPPVSVKDPTKALLQIKNGNTWVDLNHATMDSNSRIASFKVKNWDTKKEHKYRISYPLDGKTHYYEGIIPQEPANDTLSLAALTGQYHYGFPYRPVAENLKQLNPDMLFFSGDQIYEENGGYGIIRFPADKAILNYLGKWYMFGWAFGDLLKNRPSVVIPDNHEVFQKTLWGMEGKKLIKSRTGRFPDQISGFIEPAEMINAVVSTHTSHLPAPHNPTPVKQGIDVYYTHLIYAGVSFAIVGDRIFKSGPEVVASWEGRKDQIKTQILDPESIDRKELKLLGDRQIEFLNTWNSDWRNSKMKVLLSQTVFANTTTHYGREKEFLWGDLNSGGWPKSGRDKALRSIRKAFAFHICGDQHFPCFIHYGIEDYQDAGWTFCTPSIAAGYQRRFEPDRLGWEITNRPAHDNPNTGRYKDIFGNPNYIYAVGNPDDVTNDSNRYRQAQKRSSGFGFITFDLNNRTIECRAYRFLSDLSVQNPDNQFPGWPVTISQEENYGKTPIAFLPLLKFTNLYQPVIKLFNKETGKLIYSLRIKENQFTPFIFEKGEYYIEFGIPEENKWKVINNLKICSQPNEQVLIIEDEF